MLSQYFQSMTLTTSPPTTNSFSNKKESEVENVVSSDMLSQYFQKMFPLTSGMLSQYFQSMTLTTSPPTTNSFSKP